MTPRLSLSRSGDGDSPAGASPEEKEALGAATDSVRAALKGRQQRLANATKQRDAATKRHAGEVGKSQKALQETVKARKLAGGWGVPGGASLFFDHVVVKGVSHPLGPEVSAVVDSAGNISRTRRYTVTRFALLGPLSIFTPKGTKHDDRELFLLVEGPDWAELLKCNPNQQATVRSFAQKLNLAARSVEKNRAAHQQQVAAATSRLREAEANTAEVEGCERALVAELNDRSALEETLTGLDALLDRYPEPQSRSARKAAEAADAADRALNPSKARSRLAQAVARAALPAGSSTEAPPYWPPPPGWKPGSSGTNEPPQTQEQLALPPASDTNAPPFWPPPPGWSPSAAADEPVAPVSGDHDSAAQTGQTSTTPEKASLEEASAEPESAPEPDVVEQAAALAVARPGKDPSDTATGVENQSNETASHPESSPAPVTDAPLTEGAEPDIFDQIKQLGELRDTGLISAEEFEEKKRELLARL
jgi:hypothetical protein